MYCGQCGKKVLDNMLFCPFCGSPIVIPDQDAAADTQVTATESAPVSDEPAKETFAPLTFGFDGEKSETETPEPVKEIFTPSAFDFDAEKSETQKSEPAKETFAPSAFNFDAEKSEAQKPEPTRDMPAYSFALEMDRANPPHIEDIPQERETRPAAEAAERRRSESTYIPVKNVSVDDLFMDEDEKESASDDYDAYDDDYDRGADNDFEDDFEFEEREEGGFFQRHIRGIVALILSLLVILVLFIWASGEKGQLKLAGFNLAWKAKPYATLGYEAHQQGSYERAAKLYEKAFSIDESDSEYAHSAMVAYYDAENIEKAAEMLKKCIEMNPDSVDPYQEMLILYPDAQTRPWEITELLRMGYKRTGDPSLNVSD